MDKKNSLIGFLMIAAAFLLLNMNQKQTSQQVVPETEEPLASQPTDPLDADPFATLDPQVPVQTTDDPTLFQTVDPAKAPDPQSVDKLTESIITLNNGMIEVDFTQLGGAIREIRFLQTKKGGLDDFVFNRNATRPALGLSRKKASGGIASLNYDFRLVQQSDRAVVYEYDTGKGLVFQRSYALEEGEENKPYVIRHETILFNRTASPIQMSELFFNLGMATPVSSDKRGEFQSFAFYAGKKDEYVRADYFRGSNGVIGIGAKTARNAYEKRIPATWAAVKNQFFVSVLTPEKPGSSLHASPVDLSKIYDDQNMWTGITGEMGIEPGIIPAMGSTVLAADYYVGPKEYSRLVRLEGDQDKLMQFGFFGSISKLLLALMYWIHGFVPNWGLSIVIMTVIIKLVFWPLTSYSARSSKRMQLVAEPMKAVREKFKDDPQRLQKETMRLFKEHGVNPMAGCLPMLIQIPIFIGLYWMLRTSAELRFESFLWVKDLSLPDTIARIGGFPVNILPLLMGITMFFQMQLMPVSPTADPMQQKIMKFFPFMFLFFLYGFSSGLVLYWTVQNVLSIVQTVLVYRKKDNFVPIKEGPAPTNPDGTPAVRRAHGPRTTPPKRRRK